MLILSLSISLVLLDQISKFLIMRFMSIGITGYHNSIDVIPGFFNLTYIQNTGAAWGIFSGFNNWLAVLSVVVLGALVIFRRNIMGDGLTNKISLGFIIGGIIGNMMDRIRLGYVVDFLDFYYRSYHFPAFNVGDFSICTGVGLYLLWQLKQKPVNESEIPA